MCRSIVELTCHRRQLAAVFLPSKTVTESDNQSTQTPVYRKRVRGTYVKAWGQRPRSPHAL